jgi:transposase
MKKCFVISSNMHYLLPQLLPFDGRNPRSVAAIHHTQKPIELIKSADLVHFLPAYSPDLNPIFKGEGMLKEMRFKVLTEIVDFVETTFSTITEGDCYGWVEYACVYVCTAF